MSLSTFNRLLIVFFIAFTTGVKAQMNRFIVADLQIRNYGFDVGLGQKSNWHSNDFSETFGLRLGNIQHPKEVFVVNQSLPASEPFVMDKINRTWVVRPYYARSWNLSQRKSRFDVGISFQGGVHLPLAYAWPIYVWVYRSNLPFDAVEEMRYDPVQHDVQYIGGESSYTRGFSQGKLIPGLGLSAALSLEWGSYRNVSNTLSIGVMHDYFVQEIPLLHSLNDNPRNLPALFINFAVGFGGSQ